jgi:hypothetical protein
MRPEHRIEFLSATASLQRLQRTLTWYAVIVQAWAATAPIQPTSDVAAKFLVDAKPDQSSERSPRQSHPCVHQFPLLRLRYVAAYTSCQLCLPWHAKTHSAALDDAAGAKSNGLLADEERLCSGDRWLGYNYLALHVRGLAFKLNSMPP